MRWLVILLALNATAAAAETLFTVPWGKGAGQIGYHNPSTPPFDQPYGEGPAGIALGAPGEIWISDPFNDRILRFDHAGKALGAVTKLGETTLARPRTLWADPGKQVAVYNGTEMAVLWQDVATGKVQRIDKADGKNLPQVEAIAGAGDVLWIGDFMKSSLFRFDRAGTAPQKRAWGLAGLAVDAAGATWSIDHRPAATGKGEFWVVSTDAAGKPHDHFPLGGTLESPYLVGLDPKGNIIVRFIKTGEAHPNRFVIVRYDPAGKSATLGETHVSVVSQQFVITPAGSVIGLSFDAMAAPKGGVDVVELK